VPVCIAFGNINLNLDVSENGCIAIIQLFFTLRIEI